MRNINKEVQMEFNKRQSKVDASNEKYTAVEINTHCDLVEKLFSEVLDADVDDGGLAAEKYNAICLTAITEELSNYRFNLQRIEMLKESLELDLIHVTTRYLITDDKALISPSGYHPTQHVFVKPSIAIQSDNLDWVRHSNIRLKAFDMHRGIYDV